MNENHRRHLAVTFSHIDNLLAEIGNISAAGSRPSSFIRYAPSATEAQRKVIDTHITQIGQLMDRIMADLELPRPEPGCSALWAIEACINSALDAVAEINPRIMRGYGELSAADTDTINRLMAEMNTALEQFKTSLRETNAERRTNHG